MKMLNKASIKESYRLTHLQNRKEGFALSIFKERKLLNGGLHYIMVHLYQCVNYNKNNPSTLQQEVVLFLKYKCM